jgi:hypothetical protein
MMGELILKEKLQAAGYTYRVNRHTFIWRESIQLADMLCSPEFQALQLFPLEDYPMCLATEGYTRALSRAMQRILEAQ